MSWKRGGAVGPIEGGLDTTRPVELTPAERAERDHEALLTIACSLPTADARQVGIILGLIPAPPRTRRATRTPLGDAVCEHEPCGARYRQRNRGQRYCSISCGSKDRATRRSEVAA